MLWMAVLKSMKQSYEFNFVLLLTLNNHRCAHFSYADIYVYNKIVSLNPHLLILVPYLSWNHQPICSNFTQQWCVLRKLDYLLQLLVLLLCLFPTSIINSISHMFTLAN